MAGHSKWANIRFRKAAQDSKRGKIFTKLIREITVAARFGGADPEANPRLRDAISKAQKANMKRDTVENAIKRGAGGVGGSELFELRYEGYGPNGVAILVECLTDNKNRTVSEVRHAFSKAGASLGTEGSVAYLFKKQGQISFSAGSDEEKIFDIALDLGALDVMSYDDGSVEVITTVDQFEQIKQTLLEHGLEAEQSEITMHPTTLIDLDKTGIEKLLKLVDSLEDLDDVQHVYFNAEIPDEVLLDLARIFHD